MIDETNNRIIELLTENARLTYSEIGEKLNISRTAVANRITALEKHEIIKGYRVIVNKEKESNTMTFVGIMETVPEKFEFAVHLLTEMKEVITVFQTTGSNRLHFYVTSPDVDTMKLLYRKLYKEIEGVTFLTLNSVVEVFKGDIVPE